MNAIDQFAGIEPIDSENHAIIAMIGAESDVIPSSESEAGLMRRLLAAVPWPGSTETVNDHHLFHEGEEITVIVADDETEQESGASGSIIARAFQVLGYRPANTDEESAEESLTIEEIEPSEGYLGRVAGWFKREKSDERDDPEGE